DAGWRSRIANSLPVGPDTAWLEIGAGHGEMTRELARRDARVIAVELDVRLVERLRDLAGELPNVEVVAGDVLALDLERILSSGRFRVYGNLPYTRKRPELRMRSKSSAS